MGKSLAFLLYTSFCFSFLSCNLMEISLFAVVFTDCLMLDSLVFSSRFINFLAGDRPSAKSTQRAVLQKAVLSEYFAGKIDPVLCLAGQIKYICWENCFKNFSLNGHYRSEPAKVFFRTLDNL